VVSTKNYFYSRDAHGGVFSNTDPNYVQTISYPGGSGLSMTSRVYSDGLGRTLQSHAWDVANDLISALEYDASGRRYHAWRTYAWNTSRTYDPSFASHAVSRCGANPYTETLYEANPLSRVDTVKPVGCISTNEYTTNAFGQALINSNQLCTYTETRQQTTSFNPIIVSRTYTDRLGRVLETDKYASGSGTDTIRSKSRYTMLGQPDSVVSPNGYVTKYTYDFLGRMTQKIDPDGRRLFWIGSVFELTKACTKQISGKRAKKMGNFQCDLVFLLLLKL
jgi:YD repeat-containing protein